MAPRAASPADSPKTIWGKLDVPHNLTVVEVLASSSPLELRYAPSTNWLLSANKLYTSFIGA